MRVIVETKRLADAFKLCAQVAPMRSPKAILQNVKLAAEGGILTLSATDTEISISVKITEGVDIPTDGVVLLPVAKTSAILSESSEESIAIESRDWKTNLIGSRSKFQLLSESPDEFPSHDVAISAAYTQLGASALELLIHRTIFCLDMDSSRYALGAVNFESDGNILWAVGTDGRRLAAMSAAVETVGDHAIEAGRCLVPERAAKLIMRACQSRSRDAVKIGTTLNDVHIELPNCSISARQVEGRYPQWRQVLPKFELSSKANLFCGSMLAAVRQAAIATSPDSKGVLFTFADGSLRLEAQSRDVGESSVELPCAVEMNGEADSVAMQLDNVFVSEFLRALPPDTQVDCEFQKAGMPVLMSTDDGYRYVVMPMAKNDA